MQKRDYRKRWILFLSLTVVTIFSFYLFSIRYPSVPLSRLVIEEALLPSGWIKQMEYSREKSRGYGTQENLTAVWNSEQILSASPTTFMTINKYNNQAIAWYWYRYFTSSTFTPREAYYVSEISTDDYFADTVSFHCAWPSFSDRCRATAKYQQYVIIFQFDFYGQSRKTMESNFYELWKTVDKHIQEQLNAQ